MRVTIDGRLVEISPEATVGDVKQELGIPGSDALVEVSASRAEARPEKSRGKDGGRPRGTHPDILSKGDIMMNSSRSLSG